MAHKIIAADLGSSGIKLARFEASFRKIAFLDTRTIPVAAGDKPEERIAAQLQALAHAMAQDRYAAEEIVIGLPGDVLTFRIVDLPFSNRRQIEQTLGYELESLVLTPVEELVVDFVVVGPAPLAVEGGAAETRVLAACAPRALVESVVKTAQELALPLRTIGASALAYAAFLGRSTTSASSEAPEPATVEAGAAAEEAAPPPRPGAVLVLDAGAESTTVCILRDGRPEMVRSIARGGRHLTEAVAAAFKLEVERAEEAKIEAGFLADRATGRLTPAQAHMDDALRQAVAPLLRELRQTLAAHRASYGDDVERVCLTGGAARLPGLPEHFGEELGVPSERLAFPSHEGWLESAPPEESRDVLAVALGLGAATVDPALQVNFRKGEFAYRSDYSFLRDKAAYFAVAIALILCFAGFDAWASWRGLKKEHEVLAARLRKATVEVFNKERDDASAISEEVKQGPKGVGQLPIPSTTAFDLLDEISRAVPPADKIKLDILELDIKPKKASIKATTETAQQVDDFADALKKIDCFEDVQKGKLATITLPAAMLPPDQQDKQKDNKPTELKQFTISIKSSCP